MNRVKRNDGFTLIELMVALSILSIFAIVGLASYRNSFRKARDSQRQTDLETVRSALEIYRADNTTIGYPAGDWSAMLTTLGVYLPDPPTDPHNPNSVYFYQGITANSYRICALMEGDVINSPCVVPSPGTV